MGTPESHAAIQRGLDRLGKRTDRNLMKFNSCVVLHLGRNNHRHQYVLGPTQLESSCVEKDLGIVMNTKLIVSQ